MGLQRAKNHGSKTIVTQCSLHNARAVAKSSFDDILDVGAPCPENPHEIIENECNMFSVSLRANLSSTLFQNFVRIFFEMWVCTEINTPQT